MHGDWYMKKFSGRGVASFELPVTNTPEKSPHVLRHIFATHLLDIRRIAPLVYLHYINFRKENMIEYNGWWWLPDTPDYKLPGRLTIIPGEDSVLSLLGGWPTDRDMRFSTATYTSSYGTIPIIYGIDTDGYRLTLYNCRFSEGKRRPLAEWPTFYKSELTHQSYHCQTVLTGRHLDETARFKSIIVRFNRNDIWALEDPMPTHDPESGDDAPIEKFNEAISEDINIRLASEVEFRSTATDSKQTRIYRFSIKSKQGLSLDEMMEIVHHLQNLQILLMKGEYIKPIELSYILASDNEADKIWFFHARRIYRSGIEYGNDVESDIINPRVYPMFTFSEDEDKNLLGFMLRNFIKKGKEAGLAYELYFAIAKGEIPSQQQQFLSYMQAIEGLYARKYYNVAHYIDKELYESGLRKQLYAIIEDMRLFKELTGLEDDSIAQDFAKDLKNKLRHAHTYGFKKRIKEIVEKYPEEFKFAFWGEKIQRERFIKNAVDIRDYLSHGNGNISTCQGFENLKQYTAQLKLLVELCLIEMMDLPKEMVVSMIESSNRPLYQKGLGGL
jgi:hypothetical protein